ncbi:MAG: hypothetical protein SFT93_05150 [Rickettsiaceae bacterium]|nr:hypothetical protein [Rickettsiaceae bacterium]
MKNKTLSKSDDDPSVASKISEVVSVDFYNPKTIFTEESQMTGPRYFDLSKAFYSTRFNDKGEFLEDNEYKRNAGAVQLFNKNGDSLQGPYSGISESVTTHGLQKNSLGHTERILMREVLDKHMQEDFKEGGIKRPSESSKSNTDKKYEILLNLTKQAQEYGNYLESTNSVVKMWSELKPCYYNKGVCGGNCSDFIQSIFPSGSNYGYIIINLGKTLEEFETLKKPCLTNLKDGYLGYIKTQAKDTELEALSNAFTESLVVTKRAAENLSAVSSMKASQVVDVFLSKADKVLAETAPDPDKNEISSAEEIGYSRSEILERYNQDIRHLRFMSEDPTDLVLSECDDRSIVEFAIANNDIYDID